MKKDAIYRFIYYSLPVSAKNVIIKCINQYTSPPPVTTNGTKNKKIIRLRGTNYHKKSKKELCTFYKKNIPSEKFAKI